MIKRLALIEESMHNEVLWAYYHSQKNTFDEVHICCHQLCFEQLYDLHDIDSIVWYTWGGSDRFLDFLKDKSDDFSSMDKIVFTTILPKSFSFFNTHNFSNAAVVIHDMNLFFAASKNFKIRWFSLYDGFRDLVKIARYYLFREERRNLTFLKSFEELIFPSKTMQRQLPKLTSYNWNTAVWPFAVKTNSFLLKKTKTAFFEVVIPGTIIDKSRDYSYVLDALRDLDFEVYGNIRITLLGRATNEYGRTIQREFQKKWSNTRLYDIFIPQREFDEVMCSADVLILPIQPEMGIYPIVEQNGYTCVSGNINDMVKYQIPALIPSFYPIEDFYKSLVKSYSSKSQLKEKLIEIFQNMG